VNLIETLAARLAEICLADPAVSAVQITVHKPDAPITVPFDDVSVTIRRERTPAGTGRPSTGTHSAERTEIIR
jgi:dihydroneopterin aldolase